MEEYVILVDQDDNPVGTEEKLIAHQKGLCHRAFSTFVFRIREGQRQLLLQQRHIKKYHCGGLWTNTCCGHPRPDEDILDGAKRRLFEELGLRTELKKLGVFHYIASFSNGLIENEIDHVFVGIYEDDASMNVHPEEISAIDWIAIDELYENNTKKYTPWFNEALKIALLYFDPVCQIN